VHKKPVLPPVWKRTGRFLDVRQGQANQAGRRSFAASPERCDVLNINRVLQMIFQQGNIT
jgi:hypothetical protein